jgi:hypothetical protein
MQQLANVVVLTARQDERLNAMTGLMHRSKHDGYGLHTVALGLTVPLTLEVADDENLRITIGVRYDIVPK